MKSWYSTPKAQQEIKQKKKYSTHVLTQLHMNQLKKGCSIRKDKIKLNWKRDCSTFIHSWKTTFEIHNMNQFSRNNYVKGVSTTYNIRVAQKVECESPYTTNI